MARKKQKTVVVFKKRSDVLRLLILILGIVIIVQATVLVNNRFMEAQPLQPPTPTFESPVRPVEEVPLSLDGYMEAEISVSPSIIYATSSCTQISMITTESQTYSIQRGLEGKVDFRPTTHDVFKDLVENFDMTVKEARIESLVDNTFYAKLYVQQGNKILGLDSKPSDAIGVAIRFNAPVYVHQSIFEASGKAIC